MEVLGGTMISVLTSHIEQFVGVIVVVGALVYAIKKVPDLLADKAVTFLEILFVRGGPAEDKLLVAHLVYAEEKFGPGSGAQKAKWLVDKGVMLIPLPYRLVASNPRVRAKAEELFQAMFDRLEAVFLAQIKEHTGVPADSVPPIPPQP